jgi:hypothetical protein
VRRLCVLVMVLAVVGGAARPVMAVPDGTSAQRVVEASAVARWGGETATGLEVAQVVLTRGTTATRPGAPAPLVDLAVEVRRLTVDAATGVRVAEEWFGVLAPAPGTYRLDPALREAAVDAEVLLERTRCVQQTEDDPEPSCSVLDPIAARVVVSWRAAGERTVERLHVRGQDDGTRFRVLDRSTDRPADAVGSILADVPLASGPAADAVVRQRRTWIVIRSGG